MKAKRSKKWLGIIFGILLSISVVVFIIFKLTDIIAKNKRANYAPPTVEIITPLAGETVASGSHLVVSSTALGPKKIQYIEIWLDGQKTGQVFNDTGEAGPLHGLFDIVVSEGGHSLSVRAVDQIGLIGQSLPIPIYGSSTLADGLSLVSTSQEGETLEDIADDIGADLDGLNQLNPNLGGGILPPGTVVNLPNDNLKDPAPGSVAGGDGQPVQPETDTNQGAAPPNTPMLTEIARAYFTNPFKVLTQIKPPQAPDGLEVSHEGCLVTMKWNDNSEFEDSYRIWFTGLGLPPRVIATVSSSEHTGPVWYQFNTPPTGIYGFWVEAVNAIGAQPSEEFWVGIPATQCEDLTAAYLYFSIERFEILGNYDRVYCYVSIEGAPEQRIPMGERDFFNNSVTADLWGDFFPIDLGGGGFTIPYPEDGTVDIAGECMAWAGDSLNSLGEFSTTLTANDFEFYDVQQIKETNFNITVTIRPSGWEKPTGTYTFSNPLINAPEKLQITDTGHRTNPDYPTEKCLSWEWKGNESEIEGFTVFLNGNPFKLALPHERSVCYSPPSKCGMHLKFEVAANLPNGHSPRSDAKEYDQARCPLWAEVQFVSIGTGYTGSGKCDTLDTYFELHAYGATHDSSSLGMGESSSGRLVKGHPTRQFTMTCQKTYTFDDIGYATTGERGLDRLIVQIDPDKAFLEIDIYGWVKGFFGGNEILVMQRKTLPFLPVVSWSGYEEDIVLEQYFDAAATVVLVRIKAIPPPPQF